MEPIDSKIKTKIEKRSNIFRIYDLITEKMNDDLKIHRIAKKKSINPSHCCVQIIIT